MKLLLTSNVKGLGSAGEVVEVVDGYGRNYLLPRRLAVANTAANLREIERDKVKALQREAERKKLAEYAFKALKNYRLIVYMKAQADGGLYGSVTPNTVADEIQKAKNFRIDERWVQILAPIKKIGDYDVLLKMPGDLENTIKLTVLPEESE